MPIEDFIRFAEGEKLVREYKALSIRKPMKLEGNIAITNKRAIVYGMEQGLKKAQIAMDMHLDVIKGTDVYHVTKPRWFILIVGIIIALIGFSMISLGGDTYSSRDLSPYSYSPYSQSSYSKNYNDSGDFIYSLIVLAVGIILCVLAFTYPNRMFYLEIKGEGLPSLTISRDKSFWVLPGPESSKMIREIGALILDTKLLGDAIFENIDNRFPLESTTPTATTQDLGGL